MRFFRSQFCLDQKGSVSIIAAYFFIILSGTAVLTIQGSDLYVTKLRGQRTADIAALAAASTSSAIVNGVPSATAIATALNLATINGFGTSAVSTTVTSDGSSLSTTITTTADMFLSSLYNSVSSVSVFNSSTAKAPTTQTTGCVVATSGAVQVASGASVSGASCGLIAATGLILNQASINTNGVAVGYTSAQEAPLINSPTSQSPATSNFSYTASITNSLPTNTSIVAITNHLSAMSAWPYATTSPVQPSMPTVPVGTGPVGHTSGTHTVPLGHWTTLTEGNLTNLSFDGSGGPDPTCANATTFSGDALFTNTNNMAIVFNSGCYIFGGNFTVSGSMSIFATLAAGAQVTFIFKGSIINKNNSGIQLPAATYSIKGNIDNSNGNWITLGDGQKVIGGNVINSWNVINLGNGPFYFLGGITNQTYGTITIGNGPTYVYNSPVSTGTQYWSQPKVQFGNGPFYFYNSPIMHGSWSGISSLLTFGSGPYYFYNSNMTLATYSLTYFGWGAMDLYNTSINASGSVVNFGNGSNAATGSMMVSMNGGAFSFMAGSIVAKGVTMALASTSPMYFIGSQMDLEAPTSVSPSYGYQNIAIVNTGGDINIGSYGYQNLYFGGLLYAPNSAINIYWGEYVLPPSGQCLEAIASAVNIYNNASFQPAPCAGLTVSATSSFKAALQ